MNMVAYTCPPPRLQGPLGVPQTKGPRLSNQRAKMARQRPTGRTLKPLKPKQSKPPRTTATINLRSKPWGVWTSCLESIYIYTHTHIAYYIRIRAHTLKPTQTRKTSKGPNKGPILHAYELNYMDHESTQNDGPYTHNFGMQPILLGTLEVQVASNSQTSA